MEKVKHSKVELTQDNLDICLQYCASCPSYPGVQGEALFCARGESSAPATKQGCNCASCAVFNKFGCTGGYFCIEGVCE
jgi:hypothetical protein